MCECVHAIAQLLGVASLLASWSWDSDLGRRGSATSSHSLSRLLGSFLSIFYLHYVMNMFSVKTRKEKNSVFNLGRLPLILSLLESKITYK